MAGSGDQPAAAQLPDAGAAVYGLVMVAPSADATERLFWCSKQVDHGDDRMPAVEVLLIAQDAGGWMAKPRCLAHPAADDVRLLRKVNPLTACVILRIAEAAPWDDAQLPPAGATANRIECGQCGSSDFALQLGGQNHGSIICQGCRAVLDSPKSDSCSECGASIELAPVIEHDPGCSKHA